MQLVRNGRLHFISNICRYADINGIPAYINSNNNLTIEKGG